MSLLQEKWGERTIFRVEEESVKGKEMIIRLKGDPRPVESSEILFFVELVQKELSGKKTELQSIRKVKHSAAKVIKEKRALTRSEIERVNEYISDVRERLTMRGQKSLAKRLHELATEIESIME